MTIAPPSSTFTPDDVLALAGDNLFELVDGRLIEKQMSSMGSKTSARIAKVLGNHVDPRDAGEVYAEQTFQCFSDDPEKLRRPDVALIVVSRLGDVNADVHILIAPDLAVEVVSPNDRIYELDLKLIDYRSAGVKLVWVVNPVTRTIRIHRPDHSVTELVDSETITGESALPDFSSPLSELLPRKR